jgi:poly(3-hydroxybutyrate) depolymerase
MIYNTYEAARVLTRPLAALLHTGSTIARHEANPLRDTLPNRLAAALCEAPYRGLKDYGKRAFSVTRETPDGPVVLEERRVVRAPFADLVAFEVEDAAQKPKVLIAAALSGHHATLLRDTVRGFARDFAPFITDWRDARHVPLSDGDFGLDDYVDYLIRFLEALGPGAHLVATCQAAPPALMAAAVLARRDPRLVPASLTLMAGPMDTRVNPNFINKLTDHVPLKLFKLTNVRIVPPGLPGRGRRVYPGFHQLMNFILLNPKLHLEKHAGFVKHVTRGDDDAAEAFRDFYDEYFSVLDMTESFYLDTLRRVFFEHHIPRGEMTFRDEVIDFGVLDSMPLLTIEGGKDNMCSPGQTAAAHDICPNIPEALRARHTQPDVGHFGVFSGSRFQSEIYPVARDFILAHAR